MKTTPQEDIESIEISGKITDKAREFTDSEEKLGKLFFSLLDKPLDYLKKLRDICLR